MSQTNSTEEFRQLALAKSRKLPPIREIFRNNSNNSNQPVASPIEQRTATTYLNSKFNRRLYNAEIIYPSVQQ